MLESFDLIDKVNPTIDPIFRVGKNLRDIV